MKKYISLTLAVASVTLTAVVVWRLSADALALIAGVLLGMLAMSPTLLVIMWLVRSNAQARSQQQTPPAYPPIIVAGGAPISLPQPTPPAQQTGPLPPPPAQSIPDPFVAARRRWVMRVYGEE